MIRSIRILIYRICHLSIAGYLSSGVVPAQAEAGADAAALAADGQLSAAGEPRGDTKIGAGRGAGEDRRDREGAGAGKGDDVVGIEVIVARCRRRAQA